MPGLHPSVTVICHVGIYLQLAWQPTEVTHRQVLAAPLKNSKNVNSCMREGFRLVGQRNNLAKLSPHLCTTTAGSSLCGELLRFKSLLSSSSSSPLFITTISIVMIVILPHIFIPNVGTNLVSLCLSGFETPPRKEFKLTQRLEGRGRIEIAGRKHGGGETRNNEACS